MGPTGSHVYSFHPRSRGERTNPRIDRVTCAVNELASMNEPTTNAPPFTISWSSKYENLVPEPPNARLSAANSIASSRPSTGKLECGPPKWLTYVPRKLITIVPAPMNPVFMVAKDSPPDSRSSSGIVHTAPKAGCKVHCPTYCSGGVPPMKRALQTSPPVVPKPVTNCPARQVCPASARLPGSPFSPLSFQLNRT